MPADTQRPTGVVYCTTPVKPGNSGGALLDERGKVAGVIVAMSNAEMLRSIKELQDNAAQTLLEMTAALEEKQKKMKAEGDKDGYGARFDKLAKQGRESLKEFDKNSWILEEAAKYPDKSHAIDVADLQRLLAKWSISPEKAVFIRIPVAATSEQGVQKSSTTTADTNRETSKTPAATPSVSTKPKGGALSLFGIYVATDDDKSQIELKNDGTFVWAMTGLETMSGTYKVDKNDLYVTITSAGGGGVLANINPGIMIILGNQSYVKKG